MRQFNPLLATRPVAAPVCDINPERAYCLGDGVNACYFNASRAADRRWYWSMRFESERDAEMPFVDIGPYPTYENACQAAMTQAINFMSERDIEVSDEEVVAMSETITLEGIFIEMPT